MSQPQLIEEIIATAEKIRQDYPGISDWESMMIAFLRHRHQKISDLKQNLPEEKETQTTPNHLPGSHFLA
jgi:hypothetical protein